MKNFFKLDKPTFSFEIFPPKGKGDLSQIFNTVDALASLDPDLISVTYGAGGSSRENTAEIASRIQRDYAIPALAHLTCIGSTRDEMRATLDALRDKGIQNILAMRGDIVGEGCYPEKHIEAYSMEEDLKYLKAKCECGVDALISQLFFDNEHFYEFRDRARALGITQRIEAGIMPITSPAQINKMVTLCGASVPAGVQKLLRAYGHNAMAMREAGIAYATQPEIAKRICENIRGVLYSLRVKRG